MVRRQLKYLRNGAFLGLPLHFLLRRALRFWRGAEPFDESDAFCPWA